MNMHDSICIFSDLKFTILHDFAKKYQKLRIRIRIRVRIMVRFRVRVRVRIRVCLTLSLPRVQICTYVEIQ